MFELSDLLIALVLAFSTSYLITFPIRKLAIIWKVMDYPEMRKIHKKITPRMGGLAIFTGAMVGLLYLQPDFPHRTAVFIGAIIVVLTGLLDDRYQIRPVMKLTGQIAAAVTLIISGLTINNLTIPLFGMIELNPFFSVILSFFWIIGVTNSINLIDGLDGLATGVTTIALTSIMIMAVMNLEIAVLFICIALIGSNIGFLLHNFYPAKIYMGDTGSLFLGYSVAVISMLGLFKNVTLFSFIIPIMVLAVPIFDTLFSILRRLLNKQNPMAPDSKHIHYQFIAAGFSHRSTVIILYGFSALFGLLAILFSFASFGLSLTIMIVVMIILHLFAEMTGVVNGGKRPIIDLFSKKSKEEDVT